MYGLIKILTLFLVSALLCTPLMGCTNEPVVEDTNEPLTIEIYSPEDEAEFSVNVQRVTGIVSDPEATVRVNGTEANVSDDGSFYAYIDLAEGENIIGAEAVRGEATSSDTVTVDFTPALAVYLDIEYESGINYLTTTLTVVGFVSHPEATVTVDGNPVAVSADGSFTTQVQLDEDSQSITAVAKLGGEEDSYSYLTGVDSEGHILTVPGWHSFYMSRTYYENRIQLEAGEIKSFDIKKEIRKGIKGPTDFNWRIYAVDSDAIHGVGSGYEDDEIPAPKGLEVSIEPLSFTIYPNTTYLLPLTIAATPEVAPGTYSFKLESRGDSWSAGWIEITID